MAQDLIDPRIRQILEGMTQEPQEPPSLINPDIRGLMARTQASVEGAQSAANEMSFPGAVMASMGGRLSQSGLGLKESALQTLQAFLPNTQAWAQLEEMHGMNTGRPQTIQAFGDRLQDEINLTREKQLENEFFLKTLKQERPWASGTGAALNFLTEVAISTIPTLRPTGIRGKGRLLDTELTTQKSRGMMSLEEAAIGGAFGLAATGMSEEEKIGAVALGMLTGGIMPSVFVGAQKLVPLSTRTAERVIQMADIERNLDATGILTVGELTGTRGLKRLEAAMDTIPFLGLGAKRDAQAAQFEGVIESIMNRLSGGAAGRELTNESLINRVRAQIERNRKIVDEAYDNVARLMDDVPRGAAPEVRLRHFKEAAQEALDQESMISVAFQNAELKRMAQSILEDESLTFQGARRTLSRIKERVRVERAKVGRSEKTGEVAGALAQLELALIRDMDEFSFMHSVDPNNSIMVQLHEANQAYKDYLLPFYKAGDEIASIARGTGYMVEDIDGAVAAFLSPRNPQASSHHLNLLDREADRNVARFLAIREALTRSTVGFSINPKKFATELQKLAPLWETAFTKEQEAMLRGYIELTETASRAFTKESALGTIAAGGVMAATGASRAGGTSDAFAGALASILGFRLMLGTKAGTSILKELAMAKTGDKARIKALRKAEILITRYIESELPELYQQYGMTPSEAGFFENSPYRGFNPYTDPYIKRNK